MCYSTRRLYYKVVLRYPLLILILVFGLSTVAAVLVYLLHDQPLLDISEPKLGFETRGTVLSDRIRTLNYLIKSTAKDPSLIIDTQSTSFNAFSQTEITTVTSLEITSQVIESNTNENGQTFRGRPNLALRRGASDVLGKFSSATEKNSKSVKELESEEMIESSDINENSTDNYFCDIPHAAYSKVVFSATEEFYNSRLESSSLFTSEYLKSMCRLESSNLRSHLAFNQTCITETYSGKCCRSWSLGNYVALLGNKQSCDQISEDDVTKMFNLLLECSVEFKSKLDCFTVPTTSPEGCFTTHQCKQHAQILRDVMYYLLDFDFIDSLGHSNSSSLRYVASFLPIAAGDGAKDLYHSIEGKSLSNDNVKIIAIDFGIKYSIFDEYLIRDIVWLVAGLSAIFIIIWIYTAALCLAIIIVATIFITVEISYIIYTFAAGLQFFSFINLLVIVIVMGVGVDDSFVYLRLWDVTRSRKDSMTPERLVAYTIRTSARSMFATSATTSAALYTGAVSKVVALRCFGLFAGTTVAVGFLITLIVLPAAAVARNQFCGARCSVIRDWKLHASISDTFSVIFEHYLPRFIYRFHYFCTFLFTVTGVLGAVAVFIYPSLSLPTTPELRLFAPQHHFEVYDELAKDSFVFERVSRSSSFTALPMTFVWGVQPYDTGGGFDPRTEISDLLIDETFDFTSPAAQTFLVKFCRKIRSTKYYRSETGLQLTNCFIENFRKFMGRPCEAGGVRFAPCCRSATFPFTPDVFEKCLQIYLPELFSLTADYPTNSHTGIRFNKETKKRIAVVVEFSSILELSTNFSAARDFFNYMENWTKVELEQDYVPEEMKNSWFVSDLAFYDLQNTVAMGTHISVLVALGTVAIVAFITTYDIILTLASLVTVGLAVSATVGILVLIGWELNVVESVTMSVAVGLSVDYTMHYAAAYKRVSVKQTNEESACKLLTSVGEDIGGTVTLSALTTLVVGLCLLPATVLAYRQLALFLVIVVIVSYLYAVFFFQALLVTVRPSCRRFCRFSAPRCFTGPLCYSGVRTRVDKTVYSHVSESNVSSSCSTNRVTNFSDLHDVEEEHGVPTAGEGDPLGGRERMEGTSKYGVCDEGGKYCRNIEEGGSCKSMSRHLSDTEELVNGGGVSSSHQTNSVTKVKQNGAYKRENGYSEDDCCHNDVLTESETLISEKLIDNYNEITGEIPGEKPMKNGNIGEFHACNIQRTRPASCIMLETGKKLHVGLQKRNSSDCASDSKLCLPSNKSHNQADKSLAPITDSRPIAEGDIKDSFNSTDLRFSRPAISGRSISDGVNRSRPHSSINEGRYERDCENLTRRQSSGIEIGQRILVA